MIKFGKINVFYTLISIKFYDIIIKKNVVKGMLSAASLNDAEKALKLSALYGEIYTKRCYTETVASLFEVFLEYL